MRNEVEAAIARHEEVSRRLTQVANAISLQSRGDLIALRRESAVVMQDLTDTIGRALAKSTHANAGAITSEFRQRLGQMRHVIALHQGEWPAVLIGENNQAYIASARRADAAKTEVMSWIKRELLPII
jgi:hypothetical protein